jgi:hypothetical protein
MHKEKNRFRVVFVGQRLVILPFWPVELKLVLGMRSVSTCFNNLCARPETRELCLVKWLIKSEDLVAMTLDIEMPSGA